MHSSDKDSLRGKTIERRGREGRWRVGYKMKQNVIKYSSTPALSKVECIDTTQTVEK